MNEIKELIKIANRLDQAGLTKEADQVDALAASLIKSASSFEFDTHTSDNFDDDLDPRPELVEAVKKELLGEFFEISNNTEGVRVTLEDFEGIVERLWDISDPDNVKHQDQIIREIIDAVDEIYLTAKGEDEFNLRMFKQFLKRYI
jgi:hypothetical protein